MFPDDQNTIQNQDSKKNSIPPSPQEPMADIPVSAPNLTPADMPPEVPESTINADMPVSLNNTNPENEPVSAPSPNEATQTELTEISANPVSSELNEPPVVSNPEPIEPPTAQIPPNEPLAPEPEPIKQEPISSPDSSEVKREVKHEPVTIPVPIIISPKNSIRELLNKAKNAIQFRKRKKLDKVMAMFLKQSKITNDEVEKFLHVSDATATRYLSQLEKENKIKQTGKTGHSVFYSKI